MEGGYTAAEIHPDGLILGAGTADSLVRIWELRQRKARALLLFAWIVFSRKLPRNCPKIANIKVIYSLVHRPMHQVCSLMSH